MGMGMGRGGRLLRRGSLSGMDFEGELREWRGVDVLVVMFDLGSNTFSLKWISLRSGCIYLPKTVRHVISRCSFG